MPQTITRLCKRCTGSRKVRYIVFTMLIILLSVKLELYVLRRLSKTRLFFHKGFVLDTPGCKLPDYDPFHWTVRAYYQNKSSAGKVLCDETGDLVTFEDRLTPVLNERVLASRYNATPQDIACFYAEMLRNMSSPFPDKTAVEGRWSKVEFGRPLRRGEYISLRCDRAHVGTIYRRHALLARKKRSVQGHDKHERQKRLNVLVLGIDSVSRLATIRHMPLTRRYLMGEMNAFEFVGYTKLGTASVHSQLPLLTGLPSKAVDRMFAKMHYDALPHLMSVYRKRGYHTLFLEEYADYGLFTYGAQRFGFKKAPADYYPRAIMREFDSPTCSVLRYIQDLFSFDDQLLFAYVWLTDFLHGDFNGAGVVDAPVESLLRNLSSSGVLRRTALLVISDHGLRFGSARRTEMGRIEDLTPSFFLALPEHFLGSTRRPRYTYSGISLFRGISPERTCANVSVPPDFCACADSRSLPADPEHVRRLANAIMAHINGVVRSAFPGKCVEWHIDEVEEVKLTKVNETQGHEEVRFSVTISTEPSAYFDVHGWISNETSNWDLHIEDLDRLDEFDNQAKCVSSQHTARKMCRCKEYNDNAEPWSWAKPCSHIARTPPDLLKRDQTTPNPRKRLVYRSAVFGAASRRTATLRVRPTSTHRPRASTVERVPWAQRPGINCRGVDLRDFTRPHQEPSYGIGQTVYARRLRLGDLIGSEKKTVRYCLTISRSTPYVKCWAILRWASGPWENPEPYLLLPRLRVLPPVPLRGDQARERARGRAKALTLCADGHTQGSAHEHAQAEGVHRGAGPLGAASRHQLPRSGPPGLHAARPRTELRHRTDGLRTTSSIRRPHRLRQKNCTLLLDYFA
ncbi:hypothetical protein HPB51_018784 [Rhipicephalus microplus]|uniref:Uncharacterized protein n=1 Tax=Rhipicephalus microplus TaxID=6941 RepID=A0A9J6DIP6_RHIMP|nr:hypothetical protein HPB51_018784 [Rhipicephalus microplus]